MLCISPLQAQINLHEILDSIYAKGATRGVEMAPLVKKFVYQIKVVDTIPHFKDSPELFLGLMVPLKYYPQSNIYIVTAAFEDPFVAENLLAHEIGHALGLKHCCQDGWCPRIMASHQPTSPEHLVYQIAKNPKVNKKNWDEYFNNIKAKHNVE